MRHGDDIDLSPIYIPSMTDADYQYTYLFINDFIDDAIVTHANAPGITAIGKFQTAFWTWIIHELATSNLDALGSEPGQTLKVIYCASANLNFMHWRIACAGNRRTIGIADHPAA